MSYDELEEQYFIVSQQNKELERKNNSISIRNIELESTNIILEQAVKKLDVKNETLANELQKEILKSVNLKVILESKENGLVHRNSRLLTESAAALQNSANYREYLDHRKFSTRLPMDRFALADPSASTIMLNVTDTIGAFRDHRSISDVIRYHAYANLGTTASGGTRVVRYSQDESFLDLKRPEDFTVVLDQMVDALRGQIIKEYTSKNQYGNSMY